MCLSACFKNEDNLKNEDNFKNEDDLKNKDSRKYEDNIKNEDLDLSKKKKLFRDPKSTLFFLFRMKSFTRPPHPPKLGSFFMASLSEKRW